MTPAGLVASVVGGMVSGLTCCLYWMYILLVLLVLLVSGLTCRLYWMNCC